MQHQNDSTSIGHTHRTVRQRRRPRLWLGVALAALPLGALSVASASASEGEVEYRQHVMAAVGGHMQSIAAILRQKVPHQAHIGLHADALASLSGIADTLFPEGSQGGDTLPAAWQKPEDFAKRLEDFETAATGFAAAVRAGDGVGPAFQQVGQACKSCHDSYRAK
jgi:cytochrome c556